MGNIGRVACYIPDINIQDLIFACAKLTRFALSHSGIAFR